MAYTTINKSTDYFNTVLYTGDNSSPRTITGVGFQPDMNWSKIRSESNDHWVSDAVRGANKIIRPNGTDDELVNGSSGYLSSFNADGYVIASGSSSNNNFNKSSGTMVSWNWKAGTTGSGNTTGSGTYKTYSYSVSTVGGFSIIKYIGNGTTGHTIPHHLGAVPQVVLVKCLDQTYNWNMYHQGTGNTHSLYLNTNSAKVDSDSFWNDTTPSSTVFTLGSDNATNQNDQNYIAYVFTEKSGYSKFGSYTGNNNADGAFVYTGFKPEFVIVKPGNYADNWHIIDDKRNPFNPMDTHMFPNLNNGDSTASSYEFDMLSNGFKPRTNNSAFNGSYNYIYMAFGQSLVGSNNVPCTAR